MEQSKYTELFSCSSTSPRTKITFSGISTSNQKRKADDDLIHPIHFTLTSLCFSQLHPSHRRKMGKKTLLNDSGAFMEIMTQLLHNSRNGLFPVPGLIVVEVEIFNPAIS
jgi:hypothetical protein